MKLPTQPTRVLLWLLALAPCLFAAPTIIIPRIDRPPTLADFEEMAPSSQMAGKLVKVTGFVVREPADGTRPTPNTAPAGPSAPGWRRRSRTA